MQLRWTPTNKAPFQKLWVVPLRTPLPSTYRPASCDSQASPARTLREQKVMLKLQVVPLEQGSCDGLYGGYLSSQAYKIFQHKPLARS